MRTFTCLCSNEIDITRKDHVWALLPQNTIHEIEKKIDAPDGQRFFFRTCYSLKGPARETFLCPCCKGITSYDLRGNRFHRLYYLPVKHYESCSLEPPEVLEKFLCTCGETVDVSNLKNQWVMVSIKAPALDKITDAFELKDGKIKEFYNKLYSFSNRTITCPHCLGITVVQCDTEGNGLKADYYAKEKETIGKEFDTRLIY